MRFLYGFLENFFKSEEDRKKLVTIVMPSFAIQATAILLGLITNFIMARALGADKYGVFTFAFSVVFPIVSFVSFGIGVLMVREVPYIWAKGLPGQLKGLHKWSLGITLPACLLFTMLVIVVEHYIISPNKYTAYVEIAAVVIPFYGLMNYYSASLKGLNKILLSQVSDSVIRPGVFVLIIAALYVFTNNFNVSAAIYANVIAFAAGLVFAAAMFYKSFNVQGIIAEYDTKKWWAGMASLSLLNGILSLDSRLDVLMLGFIKDSSQVGIFNIAHKIALTLYFFLSVMNTIIAPSISRLHTLNDKAKLQEMLTKTIRWVTVFSLPAGILIICFSKWIMLYFGKDFAEGQTALIILCMAQLFSISCGPVGVVSVMTGHEKYNTFATLIGMTITIAGNLLLTPTLGITGCAIAAACSIVVWNIFMVIAVKNKVGVSPWIYKVK